ncbi:hypothetical protein H0H81_010094 [Sphagnurus paluster]|uniref:Uncharacterized protein n=1 Tax=Sphagnurus paluster TaxID=117069 RepID=A0A9P7K4D2_9AGAR|nr:hypothetical protein H0H81_010094 [Sphagnurus paluster]
MQNACQFAGKLLQMESASLAIIPPANTLEITPQDFKLPDSTALITATNTSLQATCLTPAPSTFTMSYTPLSMSLPDPLNPAALLETDAVQVTWKELALMLNQLYLHSS